MTGQKYPLTHFAETLHLKRDVNNAYVSFFITLLILIVVSMAASMPGHTFPWWLTLPSILFFGIGTFCMAVKVVKTTNSLAEKAIETAEKFNEEVNAPYNTKRNTPLQFTR